MYSSITKMYLIKYEGLNQKPLRNLSSNRRSLLHILWLFTWALIRSSCQWTLKSLQLALLRNGSPSVNKKKSAWIIYPVVIEFYPMINVANIYSCKFPLQIFYISSHGDPMQSVLDRNSWALQHHQIFFKKYAVIHIWFTSYLRLTMI